MNKLNKILLMLILSLSFSYAKADCSEEELTKLKEEADKIEITYKHLEKDNFIVNVENINDDFYIDIEGLYESKFKPKNGKVTTNLVSDDWIIDVYHEKCEKQIDSISFRIPRYNIYYEDDLCKGIDPNKFALCGKYYEYNISREEFEKRVKSYRNEHNISNTDENKSQGKKNNHYNKIINILSKYKIQIAIIIPSLTLVLCTIILILKRKNRGVLK